jgi:[acyl-carrier-protein] S-malonyltransferase
MPWVDSHPAAAATLQLLSASIDPAWRSRLGDARWASDNRNAQPLITGLSIAAWTCLTDQVPAPAVVAGYSVGELAAFCAAGVYDPATAMSFARERAAAMDLAAAGLRMGLLAVRGLQPPMLKRLCERHALAPAIRLGHDSAIVGGLAPSLDAAEADLAATGLRATRLAVNVASHTPWMAAAAAAFAERLGAAAFAPPTTAIVCNFDATAHRGSAELAHCLAAQIASPIAWDSCTDAIAERGVRCVLEVGPGAALAAHWRARHPDVPVRSVEDFRSPEAVADWVRKTLEARNQSPEPGGAPRRTGASSVQGNP